MGFDADELAKQEIQLSKNGATNNMFGIRPSGQPLKAAGITNIRAGKNWKGDNWEKIPVDESEINRRKYRNASKNYPAGDGEMNIHKSINSRHDIDKRVFKKEHSWETPEYLSELRNEERKLHADAATIANRGKIDLNPDYMKSLKNNAKKRKAVKRVARKIK